jgi:hypothetical protein
MLGLSLLEELAKDPDGGKCIAVLADRIGACMFRYAIVRVGEDAGLEKSWWDWGWLQMRRESP